jgi:hypothetical protein
MVKNDNIFGAMENLERKLLKNLDKKVIQNSPNDKFEIL